MACDRGYSGTSGGAGRLLRPFPRPAMRRLLPALVLVLGGCGTLVPYSLAPSWLAPEIAPPVEASAVVVTREDAAALSGRTVVDGRVLDEATGQPVAGVAVAGGAAEAVSGADGRFALDVDAGGVALRAARDGYVPAEAALRVAPDTRASVLVLLTPRAAEDLPTGPER